MKLSKYIYVLAGSVSLLIADCKKPYQPREIALSKNYLVVEGVITGQDSTIITLNRTVNLSGKTVLNPEKDASVAIESDKGEVIPSYSPGNGKYYFYFSGLDASARYRVRIKTSDGREYLSDFEPVKNSPPIDSIGYTMKNNGIGIYANTHDASDATRYYRWSYAETWQFHAKYQSDYISDGSSITGRNSSQLIYRCFSSNSSSTIVLGSSARLKEDVIYQNPILDIASTSEKIETKYSILVKQYALTQSAFNFWQNLKKNTEQLGSIFDPQPSNINGNIHCLSDPSEPVIGYISVGTVQQKRIFISAEQLPREWAPTYPYDCKLDSFFFCHHTACINEVAQGLIPLGSPIIIVAEIRDGPAVIGYLGSSRECTDCTIRGTKQQPDFWR